MTPPAASLKNHFLSWHQPVTASVVDWLEPRSSGTRPLQFDHILLLVPTARAGLRIRAELANRFRGCLPPRILTPAQLMENAAETPNTATPLQSAFAWLEVLHNPQWSALGDLFPRPPGFDAQTWTQQTAQALLQLQRELTEAGHTMASASNSLPADHPDKFRWQQLALIENEFHQILSQQNCQPASALLAQWVQNAPPIEGIQIYAVALIPDIASIVTSYLRSIASQGFPTYILTAADPGQREAFHPSGQPDESYWQQCPLPETPAFQPAEHIHQCRNPWEQADRIADILHAATDPQQIAAPDPEVTLACQHILPPIGVRLHDPGGSPLRESQMAAILQHLLSYSTSESFDALASLFQLPLFYQMAATVVPNLPGPDTCIAEIDRVSRERFPQHTSDALRDHKLTWLAQLSKLLPTRTSREYPPQLWLDTLLKLCSRLELSQDNAADAPELATLETWIQLMQQAATWQPAPTPGYAKIILEQTLASHYYPPREEGATDLLGWLELPWQSGDSLILPGFNEGHLPFRATPHPLLPAQLRKTLGLRTSESLAARDTYLLHLLIHSRNPGSKVNILLSHYSNSGEPVHPSRLLLATTDEKLPARVQQLFSDPPPPQSGAPGQPLWQLQPQLIRIWHNDAVTPKALLFEEQPAISITAFSSYLYCPFRFYLDTVLRAKPLEPLNGEMDAMQFGNSAHDILEQFHNTDNPAQFTSPDTIRKFFHDTTREVFDSHYGTRRNLALRIQEQSIIERLCGLADSIALSRQEGWLPWKAEWDFHREAEPILIDGIHLKGRLDLIEIHSDGRLRVLDYKTSDKGTSPFNAHVATFSTHPPPYVPEYAIFEYNGQNFYWKNLQLPLYVHICQQLFSPPQIIPAYGILAKDVNSCRIEEWNDYDPAWTESALICASGILRDIRNGRFWPPRDPAFKYDERIAELFPNSIESDLAFSILQPEQTP